MNEELLTVAEIAERLKVNQQTVRNWIDRGELQKTKIGRRVRVRATALEAYLRGEGTAPLPPLSPAPEAPERRRATAHDIKVIERVIETMLVTSADLPLGSALQRELAESAGRLQAAVRRPDTIEDPALA